MTRWQARLFSTLFWRVPIPAWVMRRTVTPADVLMMGSGVGAAALSDHHPMASRTLFVCALAVGALLLVWHTFVAHRLEQHYHRLRHGLCIHCGYDLRATTARCPECGEVAGFRPSGVVGDEADSG